MSPMVGDQVDIAYESVWPGAPGRSYRALPSNVGALQFAAK